MELKWGKPVGREDWQKAQAGYKANLARQGAKEVAQRERRAAKKWGRDMSYGSNRKELDAIFGKQRPLLPICPYGCGREGTLLEVVMLEGGRAMGIFNDYPCSCIFVADIQLPEPPRQRKQKIVIGADGEAHMVSEDAE
jgi:hypothetical protein